MISSGRKCPETGLLGTAPSASQSGCCGVLWPRARQAGRFPGVVASIPNRRPCPARLGPQNRRLGLYSGMGRFGFGGGAWAQPMPSSGVCAVQAIGRSRVRIRRCAISSAGCCPSRNSLDNLRRQGRRAAAPVPRPPSGVHEPYHFPPSRPRRVNGTNGSPGGPVQPSPTARSQQRT
jgi:hypothetical protein